LGAAVERKSRTHYKEIPVKIGTTVARRQFISVPQPDVGFNFGIVNLLRKTIIWCSEICLVATAQFSLMKGFLRRVLMRRNSNVDFSTRTKSVWPHF
jgi:hypothetical protein